MMGLGSDNYEKEQSENILEINETERIVFHTKHFATRCHVGNNYAMLTFISFSQIESAILASAASKLDNE